MAMNLAPYLKQRYLDANGDPLAGGKLHTYQSGTTTNQATYTDSGGGTPNANPVVLDANGEANVWVDPTLSYRFVLKDSDDVTQWTVDGVIGLISNDAVATASIQDLAISTAKIADDAVTAAKLKDSASVDADRAVTSDHIRDAAITRAKLTTGSIAPENVSAVKTAAYTATTADDLIFVSGASAAHTQTLPASSTMTGRRLRYFRTDNTIANLITIDGSGGETINGSTTVTMVTQYEFLEIEADGSNWIIIQRRTKTTATAYTPAPVGFGTIASLTAHWERDGQYINIYGRFQSGTSTGVEAQIPLPTGFTSDSSYAAIQVAGIAGQSANTANSFYAMIEPSVAYFVLSKQGASNGMATKLLGNEIAGAGTNVLFQARIRCTNLAA